MNEWFDCGIQCIESTHFDRVPQTVAGISKRLEGTTKFLHRILQFHISFGRTVSSGLNVVASLRHLLTDDGTDGFRHVARLCHLFLDFGCTQSEVVKDHQRLTTETRDYTVNHIIDRLPRVLCFLLGEGEHCAQFLDGQFEVAKLHGSFHQFEVGHGSVRCLAQSLEDVTTTQTLEGNADALTLLGEFDTLLHGSKYLTTEFCHRTSCLCQHVTGKHLKRTRHLIAHAAEKPATASIHVWQLNIVQRTIHLLNLFVDRLVFLLHLVDGLQIILTDYFLLSLRHAVVLHRQLLDSALIIVHLAFGGLGC